MNDFNFLAWVFGIVSLYLTYKWQSASTENEKLKDKLNFKKEELYTKFIEYYMSLVENPEPNQSVKKMREFNQQMLLISSNKVLLTYGDMMQTIYKTEGKDTTKMLRLIGELIVAMREDLGHSDWLNQTQWYDTVRPWMKDTDKLIKLNVNGLRRTYSKIYDPSPINNLLEK